VIGMFGGTCNNMYVFAKILADYDYKLTFIEDRGEKFPHGQPVWDDVEACFTSGFDQESINWLEFEAQYGWQPQDWYFRPTPHKNGAREIFKASPAPLFIKLLACRYLGSSKLALSIFNKMRECDFLIVCGVKAAILAMLSAKPYMIFPHGSDMRVAIGAEQKGRGIKGWLFGWLVSRSFKAASFIGSSLPDGSAEVEKSQYRRCQDLRVERVALPYLSKPRLEASVRREKLKILFQEMGLELQSAHFYSFTPSRINFHWKGHDRLLRAIEKNRQQLNIHFIFLGWGDDYKEASEYVAAQGLQSMVTVLPVFLSKKFLFRFFESVDFIIDELNGSGSYGTSLSEAMSVGCPVVTWISDMFDRPGWERPPVIYARTEEELGQTMLNISSEAVDLTHQSGLVAEWFARVHAADAVLKALDERIAEFV